MTKYRKKPVVIEAEQFLPPEIVPEGVELIVGEHEDGLHYRGVVQTLEGPLVAKPEDWIITGVKGEKYPCKPDIFEATYEPA